MWKFIKSFLVGDSEADTDRDLILRQSLDFVRTAQANEKRELAGEQEKDEKLEEYSCFRNTGVITDKENNTFVINNKYKFKSDLQGLDVGTEVSFTAYFSDGYIKLTDIVIHNAWSSKLPSEKSSWCLRTIICKVVKREDRQVIVNPGDLVIDLNTVASEFIPIVGDWLELEAKVQVEEQVTDLCGTVLEIHKIHPLRPQILEGCIRQWNNKMKTGAINHSIFFNEGALSSGYVPLIGDRVVTEIIESDQGRYTHRSLKIIPEKQSNQELVLSDAALPKYKNTLDGISVSEDISIDANKLGETHKFEIKVRNISQKEILLLSVTLPLNNNQCKIIKPLSLSKIRIAAGQDIKFEGLCTVKNMGKTRELVLFSFATGRIGRWITIDFELKHGSHQIASTTVRQRGIVTELPFKRKTNELIKGQRLSNPPRFINTRLPESSVPEELFNIVNKHANETKIHGLLEDLRAAKRCLSLPLSLNCYEDFFRTLLFLEEIQELAAISSYAQKAVCLIRNGEYLMLEIENLGEKRPSLMIGDRIIAKETYNEKSPEYEGFIYKVGAKHVYLKFDKKFHEDYDEKDMSVIAVASRTTYRRMHQAIGWAVKNLGSFFLFPDKVPSQKSQVNIIYDPYYNSVNQIHNKSKHSDIECIDEKNLNENKSIDINYMVPESSTSGNVNVEKNFDNQKELKTCGNSPIIDKENKEDMKSNRGLGSHHVEDYDIKTGEVQLSSVDENPNNMEQNSYRKEAEQTEDQKAPVEADEFCLENISKSHLLLNEEFSHLSKESNKKCPRKKNTNFSVKKTDKLRKSAKPVKLKWYNNNLNYYQKEAVRNIVIGEARPLPYFIFGPPGTGKTITLVETILQLLTLIPHSRLLVGTPSNSAADLIALRLIDSGVLRPGDLIRLVAYRCVVQGMLPLKLVPYSATADIGREGTHGHNVIVNKDGLTLGCNSRIVGRHRITIGTCSSLGVLYTMGFSKGHFTHVIMDEAGQATEPEVMIPLSLLEIASGQVVLAGDPLQLGPVIASKAAAAFGLEETFLDRMLNRFPYVRDPGGFPETGGYDPRLITKLVYNYRSLPEVLLLCNNMFYNCELIPTISETDSTEAKLLYKFKDILPKGKNSKPPAVVFHGVIGENYQTADCPSWFNPSEAGQIFYYVLQLYHLGLKNTDIGIISPYIKQVREIRELFVKADCDIPKIGTVEEFQGQEFNVILLSTVRSNKSFMGHDLKHKLGFLANPRRVNVAITRAQVLMILVGNPHLLCSDAHWRSVIKHCVERGSYVGCELPNKV